jgi:hypothetical protein
VCAVRARVCVCVCVCVQCVCVCNVHVKVLESVNHGLNVGFCFLIKDVIRDRRRR